MTKQSYPSLFTLTIGFIPISIGSHLYNFDCEAMSPVKNWYRQLVLSRDHFSNYLKQHDDMILLSANRFIEVHVVNTIKESKCSRHKLCMMLSYYNFH